MQTHSPQEASGSDRTRRIATLLILLLFLALIAFLNYRKSGEELVAPLALENAQLARNIVEGKGFHTNIVRPIGLSHNAGLLREVGGQIRTAHPDMVNPPLYPLYTAVLFALAGSSDRTAALASALASILAAWMTYLLARRLFNERIALWSVAVFWILPSTASLVFSGTPAPWAAFLATALFWTLAGLKSREESIGEETHKPLPVRKAFGIGVLFGLCYLSQYSLISLLLPVLAYFYITQRPKATRPIAFFLAGFLVISSFWMLRNLAVAHNPFFQLHQYEMMTNTPDYPGDSVYRQWENVGQPIIYILTHPRYAVKRVILNWFEMHRAWPGLVGSYLMPLFLLALLIGFRQKIQDRFKMLAAVCLLFLAVDLSIGKPDPTLFFALTPVMMIFSLALTLRLLEAMKAQPWVSATAAAAVFIWLLLPTAVNLIFASPPRPDSFAVNYKALDEKSVQAVITDRPWQIAWRANRVALWLPSNPKEFCRQFPGVDGIYLTVIGNYNEPDTAYWGQALQGVVDMASSGAAGRKPGQKGTGKLPEPPKSVIAMIPDDFSDAALKVYRTARGLRPAYAIWRRPQASQVSRSTKTRT